MKWLLAICGLTLCGCTKHSATVSSGPEIHIEDVRADVPQFKRLYKAQLNQNVSVTVTMRTYNNGKHDQAGAHAPATPEGEK